VLYLGDFWAYTSDSKESIRFDPGLTSILESMAGNVLRDFKA